MRQDATGRWHDAQGRFTSIQGYSGKIVETDITISGVTATRVKIGTAKGKIAVIGRGQTGRVRIFADGIRGEIFKPSKSAVELNKSGDSSLLMKENLDWANRINREGYTVYDVGLDPKYTSRGNLDKGPFYGWRLAQYLNINRSNWRNYEKICC